MELLRDRQVYKGSMVDDANTYYNENVNGIYKDSSSKKIDESKMTEKGKEWLYLEEKAKPIVEAKTEKVVVKKMEYKAKVFDDKDVANKWMEKNKGWGVIKTEKGKVYVAKNDDKGKKIDESLNLSENIKSASQWL